MKKILLIIFLIVAFQGLWQNAQDFFGNIDLLSQNDDSQISEAFEKGKSDLQVRGAGTVIKILPDDLDGSRHQRFVIRMNSGQTLLIAHNIDLAPKITLLDLGDEITFYGEYEWNSKGGVIHWTHHDPQGRHVAGWLMHRGRKYQ
ncbi:MAG: DUF3465 domain-containing protein [Gammaproteobacteria bacterium]